MRCIIVDDDELAVAHLQRLCGRIENLEVIQTFTNSLTAYTFLQENNIDLAFMDIEMPDLTGIELAKNLTSPPAIIFVSAKESYAIKTFDFIESVVDYIIKPITLPRLLKAISRFNKLENKTSREKTEVITDLPVETTEVTPNSPNKNFIFVKSDRKYVRIDLSELLYIETVGDYSIFKTSENQYTVHATLKSIDERLDNPNFFRVHRSFIVNISKIKDIEDYNLLIADKIIPISRANRADLMGRISPI